MKSDNKTIFIVEHGKQEVVITRIFNTPRELVFKAFTDPVHIPNWWGPKSLTTAVEKMEVKEGGIWRFIQRDHEGNIFAFHGVFHELTFPERIINTFEFEGLPEKGHVILETKKFLELPGGRTKLAMHDVYQSLADRDGMVNSGMEDGLRESMDRFEKILTGLMK